MTLQSSGAISLSQVNTELGLSSTASISLNDAAVRTLAGVASGAISMSNLYGKSNAAVWTPAGGTSAGSPVAVGDGSSTQTITCSQTATWTWTRSGSTAATASIATGGSGATITFNLPNATTIPRSSTFTLSSTAGGVTRYWSVSLTNEGFA